MVINFTYNGTDYSIIRTSGYVSVDLADPTLSLEDAQVFFAKGNDMAKLPEDSTELISYFVNAGVVK